MKTALTILVIGLAACFVFIGCLPNDAVSSSEEYFNSTENSSVMSHDNTEGSFVETPKNAESEPSDQQQYENYSDGYIGPRTAWNIELSYLYCTDEAIVIEIRDYDNQGFAFNYLYFELEYFENGSWTKISRMNRNSAMTDLCYSVPDTTGKGYADLDCHNYYSLLPGVTLKSGHYRITKVLSGRDFSVEFDLNFD